MSFASEAVLAAAREKFFSGHALPDGLVPAPILRSWQRCAQKGLDAFARVQIEPMSAHELRQLQQANEHLRYLSRPELVSLRAEARSTDSIVILTDARGMVLDSAGSTEFAGQAASVALRPGVDWAESSTGTNAIGTAIAERRAIEVHGGEHFFEPHGILHCAASPIFDPYGKLAGILDMSGHASANHLHALGLVRLAVEQIEHRYFAQGFEDRLVIRFHRSPDLLGTAREGILVFEDEQLVAGNRRALSLLGLDGKAFRRLSFADIFADRGGDGLLETGDGERFAGRLQTPRPRRRPVSGKPKADADARHPGFFLTPDVERDLSKAVRLVDADIPVLVGGQTGTGKEVFARKLHGLSRRAGKPFIAINCAALPENLIEAELFGYEPGAFTGARKGGARGLVQQAGGGILFLDEIGDMPLGLQSRLLRVLQDKEVTPLGGGQPQKVDFATICATNRDLKSMVDAGLFRADLYFRIAQYGVILPAIADMADIAAVIETLWSRIGADFGDLPEPVLSALSAHCWPGNFRELTGMLKAMAALAEPGRPIGLEALPDTFRPAPSPRAPALAGEGLARVTEAAMRRAVAAHKGNLSAAARALGIDRSTLYRRLVWSGRLDG